MKKLLSVFLALVMLLSLLGVGVAVSAATPTAQVLEAVAGETIKIKFSEDDCYGVSGWIRSRITNCGPRTNFAARVWCATPECGCKNRLNAWYPIPMKTQRQRFWIPISSPSGLPAALPPTNAVRCCCVTATGCCGCCATIQRLCSLSLREKRTRRTTTAKD